MFVVCTITTLVKVRGDREGRGERGEGERGRGERGGERERGGGRGRGGEVMEMGKGDRDGKEM